VVLFAVVLVGYIVISHDKKTAANGARAVRVTSSKLVTKDGTCTIRSGRDVLRGLPVPASAIFERGTGRR